MDKVIVSHQGSLVAKYGPVGANAIDAAITRLIARDAARGLTTSKIYLDLAMDMAPFGAPVPPGATEKDFKDAIDRIFAAEEHHYLMILGANDVVPHQSLNNPIRSDSDANVPSDLPYACTAPYGTSIASFLTPSRVVGRLPDVNGASVSLEFEAVIDRCGAFPSHGAASFGKALVFGAQVWSKSTALNAATTFGATASVFDCPPDPALPAGWSTSLLNRVSHFINCHGSSRSSVFVGESAGRFPVALDSGWLPGKVTEGTLCAAECCYGAELYAPRPNSPLPICNRYMVEGAMAFVGSTNIAYGPAVGNKLADLVCQYFFAEVLSGSSTGKALLAARLKFIGAIAKPTAVDQKTLAQFLLLGDPSETPISSMHLLAVQDERRVLRISSRAKLSSEAEAIEKVIAPAVSTSVVDLAEEPGDLMEQARARIREEIGAEVTFESGQKFVAENASMRVIQPQTLLYGQIAGPEDGATKGVIVYYEEYGGGASIQDVFYEK